MRIETVGNITKVDKLNAKSGTMSLKELVGKESAQVVGAMFFYKDGTDENEEERISYIKFADGTLAGGKSAVIAEALELLFEDESLIEDGIACEVIQQTSNSNRDFLNLRWV